MTDRKETSDSAAIAFVPWLLVGSGFCSLIYQTVWFREFRLIFGSSTPSTAAVLSIFMGAIGVGSAVLGRRAERSLNGLAFYANLELLIALTAAVTPLLTMLVRAIYYATGGASALGGTVATIVRLLLSVVVLGAPTFLMGGTLPAAVKYVTREADASRRSVAGLYAANTFGGVVGTILSTFVLLELLGTRNTLFLAAALNLLVALIARTIARRNHEAEMSENAETSVEEGGISYQKFLLFAAFGTGFAFFFLELVWYRMLGPILGGSTFTFGLILGFALLGIGIGGLIYSRAEPREATLSRFGLTCALEAAAIMIPYALGDRLALFAVMLQPLRNLGFDGQILAWSLITCVVVVPAAIIAGYQFPLIVALAGRGAHKVSRHLGDIYAWNTAGAILGSLAGGFGLIPILGATGAWKTSGWLMALLAILALVFGAAEKRRTLSIAATAIALFAIILSLISIGPTAAWRHAPIGAGRVALERARPNAIRDWQNARRRTVKWEVDGFESSVALATGTGWAFIVNGKSDGDSMGDAGTMIMSGLLPALLLERPERALVIGLGIGGSAGWLGAIPTMKQVDVYELEPAILRVAAECAPVNYDVLNNKKVNVTIGDARELLLTSRSAKYDIIFSEPSNPFRSGVASLFTRDYYEAVADRLTIEGRFVQWVQAYEIDAETLHTIYATIHSVFPEVQTWQTWHGDIVLIAGDKPLEINVDRMRERMAIEPYRTAVRGSWRVSTVEEVLAFFVGNERFGAAMATSPLASINTDNRNLIEFGFARTMGISTINTDQIRNAAVAMGADQPIIKGSVDHALIRDARAGSPVVEYQPPASSPRERALRAATIAFQEGRYSSIVPFWTQLGRPLRPGHETLMGAMAIADRGDAAAEQLLKAVGDFQPVEALVVLARLRSAQGRHAEAAEALAQAFDQYHHHIWADPKFMRHALKAAVSMASRDAAAGRRLYESLRKPYPLELLREERVEALFRIGSQLEGPTCGDLTLFALSLTEPEPLWVEQFLRTRYQCYAHKKHPLVATAQDELVEFLAAEQSRINPATVNPDAAAR